MQRSELERERLVGLLEEQQAEAGRASDDPQDAEGSLQQRIEELERCLSDKGAKLAQASAERERLAKLLETRDRDHQTGDLALNQPAEEIEKAPAASVQEWDTRCAELTARPDEQALERDQLTSTLQRRG